MRSRAPLLFIYTLFNRADRGGCNRRRDGIHDQPVVPAGRMTKSALRNQVSPSQPSVVPFLGGTRPLFDASCLIGSS